MGARQPSELHWDLPSGRTCEDDEEREGVLENLDLRDVQERDDEGRLLVGLGQVREVDSVIGSVDDFVAAHCRKRSAHVQWGEKSLGQESRRRTVGHGTVDLERTDDGRLERMELNFAVALSDELLLLVDGLEPLLALNVRLVPERERVPSSTEVVERDRVAVLALLLGLRIGQRRRAGLAGSSPVEEGLGPDAVLGEVVLLVGRDHRQEFERYRPLIQAELRLGLADGLVPSEDEDVVK